MPALTHGLSDSTEHRIWRGIKTRCYNTNRKEFPYYGGRGIKVCDRWIRGDAAHGGFECFLADLGPRPGPEYTVERVDNDGDYEPSNCIWLPQADQILNSRRTLKIEWRGETLTTREWSARTGVSRREIARRLHRGWDTTRALTQRPKRQPTGSARKGGRGWTG